VRFAKESTHGGNNDSTLDTLVKKLGNIPLSRVLIDPPPGTATEVDVLVYLEAPQKRICE
jgi:hypothetical protein